MRILIDLQGAQSPSRYRGIGRYATALAKAIIRNRGDHEIFILLNGVFCDTIDQIKDDFSSILPADRVVAFAAPSPVEGLNPDNAWRKEAAELIREWMINDIAPDVLLITSLFEGATDNCITSIGHIETSTRIAVILHDLIPFLDPEPYLHGLSAIKWYYSKIDSIRRADLLLAVSDSSRYEAIDALGFPVSRTATIYAAADENFTVTNAAREAGRALLERLHIRPNFLLHAGVIEPRKNFEGLIRAFALLPEPLRQKHQLVLAVGISPLDSREALHRLAAATGLKPGDLVCLDYVSDSELVALYSLCALFVFPSLHEGFGLPVLEAMGCGTAVIGSNATSIPEVIGREDALFDPYSDQSIAQLLERALTDTTFYQSLKTHALQQSKRFSWDKSAKLALRAIEEMSVPDGLRHGNADISLLLDKIAAINVGASPSPEEMAFVSQCIAQNERTACELNPALHRSGSGGKAKIGYREGHTGEIPSSRSDVEVIRRDVWLRDDQPRILLLKLDHIGDFILTLDAFRLIRDTWPKAHVTLVCGSWNKSLAEQSGLFDIVFCCEFFSDTGADHDKETAMKHGVAKYLALDLGVYDLAVDLRCYDDNRVLLLHTDTKYRVGYAAAGVPLDLALPMGPESETRAHIGARTMALAAAVAWTFGVPLGNARDGLMNEHTPIRLFKDGVAVGIAPGTGNPIKSWGRERFAELACLLHRSGDYRFVLIGSDRDRSDTQFIGDLLPAPDFVDLAGAVAIADLPPVIAGLDLFIGNDTGTTHIAAMMGIPTVCIYSGQTFIDSWRPVGAHVVALRKTVDCAPCYLSKIAECPWNLRCMDIPPSRVAAEVIALRLAGSAIKQEPRAERTPLPAHLAERRAGRQIVFDISDLIEYFSGSRLPTGIQRVQINVVSSLLRRRERQAELVVACTRPETDFWMAIPERLFLRIAGLAVSGGSLSDPEWQAALAELQRHIENGDPLAFEPGATLINLGTSWWLPNYFLMVRNAKARCGIRYVPFVHDCIPIVRPEHCIKETRQDFVAWVTGVFLHADDYLANSRATASDLTKVARLLGHRIPVPKVVRLDGRLSTGSEDQPISAGDGPGIIQREGLGREPFVLFVGTVEARKNHLLAFNAWLAMIEKRGVHSTPALVCVGKRGWMVDAAMARLNSSELLSQKVRMLAKVSDGELAELYQNCLFTIFPSFYEGWGLPVTEALCHGKVPLTAAAASLPEAGGDFAEYFNPHSEGDFLEKLERLIDDEDYRGDRELRIKEGFRVRGWDDIADEIVSGAICDDEPLPLDAAEAKGIWPLKAQTNRYHRLARNLNTNVWADMTIGEIYRIGSGWWEPEDWGSWAKGDSCDIAFRIEDAADCPYLIYLGLLGIPCHDLDYRASIVGTQVETSGNLGPGQRHWFSLTVPSEVASGGIFHLRVMTTGYCDLGEMTNGQDWRIVTLGVIGFYVCREDDLSAQQRFSDALSRNRLDQLTGQPDTFDDDLVQAAE